MTTYERDQWDKIGDSTSEGARLKCANKGRWTLDDIEISTGPDGFKIAVIMPSIVVGRVRWFESRIAERDIGRIEHGFEPPEGPREGWNPYVQFLAVRADEENLGELLSFANSSWGGQSAYRSLVNPYRFKNRLQFPICTLGTRERKDANHNVDPTFRIVAWADRRNFAELLPDEAPQIEHAPAKQIGATYTTGERPVEAEPLGDNEPLSANFEPPEF